MFVKKLVEKASIKKVPEQHFPSLFSFFFAFIYSSFFVPSICFHAIIIIILRLFIITYLLCFINCLKLKLKHLSVLSANLQSLLGFKPSSIFFPLQISFLSFDSGLGYLVFILNFINKKKALIGAIQFKRQIRGSYDCHKYYFIHLDWMSLLNFFFIHTLTLLLLITLKKR